MEIFNKKIHYRKYLALFVIFLAIMSLFGITNSNHVQAVVNLNPDPTNWSTVPSPQLNYLKNADTYAQSPAYIHWISKGGTPASNHSITSVDVAYGQTSVTLALNLAGVVGKQPSSTVATNSKVTSVSVNGGTISGLDNENISLNFGSDANTLGAFRHEVNDFTFTPTNGFTQTGTYTINVVTKTINQFSGNPTYRCVPNGSSNPTSFNNFGPCDTTGWSFQIHINVLAPYQVGSYLVEGPQGNSSGNINMPNASQPDIGYHGENNVIFNIGATTVADNKSHITMTSANGSYATNVFAPAVITRNGVDWILKGSSLCDAPSPPGNPDCRTAGGDYKTLAQMPTLNLPSSTLDGRKYREIPANHPKDEDMRVYWYYEPVTTPPPPAPTCSITLTYSGLGSYQQYLNNVPSSVTQVKVKWTSTDTNATGHKITANPGGDYLNLAANSTPATEITYTLTNPGTTFTGNFTGPGGTAPACTASVSVAPDQPYLKVYGNDVAAGNGVGTGCSVTTASTTATIDANAKSINPGIGAGTQFAAYAPGTIKGFLSAVTRQGAPAPPNSANGLTFGNSTNGTSIILPIISDMGGKSATTRCMPDYVGMAEDSANAGSINTMNQSSISAVFGTPLGGSITVPKGVRSTSYHNGAFTIDRNIQYDLSGWNTAADIPSSTIVVRGDVYITSNVSNIDGWVIASGTIYTCTNGAGNSMPNNGTCNTKLTVNGAFMASTVKFWRTIGKVADSIQNENSGSTNIAEVFNFSPETYVAPMPDLFKRTSAYTKYDYLTALPPTL